MQLDVPPFKRMEILLAFAERIRAGECPAIINATYSSAGFAMGELCEIGFARKRHIYEGSRPVGVRWHYVGPGPILFDGERVEPNTWIGD